ncbi:hypothetical protein RND81_05G272800 [Saponaria officinalis]|uniref:F-box domain-containing protein n=1 Tax=Saponaria officinalis TaxID=3572 RepID=A0AAW1L2H3_SAPOF
MENLDRITQLPEPLIFDILSRLPFEDYARASILSKTWKSLCNSYPLLYFDHNLFAQQYLASNKNGSGEADINQIRDMFLADEDYQLSVRQLDLPFRKIAFLVALNDSEYFSRVDTWLELVKQIHVEDLCIVVQTADYLWENYVDCCSALYEFPMSAMTSKGLRSVYIRGCKFRCETFVDPIDKRRASFSSLQQLYLSHVFLDEDMLENLTLYCQGIESLTLDTCFVMMEFLKLSKFPKLKKAIIGFHRGEIDNVDITDTNLECFKCDAKTNIYVSPAVCAGIRELRLVWHSINLPNLYKDLTATFPLLEEVDIFIENTDTLKAANNTLRKLRFVKHGFVNVKEVRIDCPRLTLLKILTNGLTEVYVDCPKLRVFKYCGNTIPSRISFSSMPDLEESSCEIYIKEACDTLWLINLRAFLILVMGNVTNISLSFKFPMATFKPEEVEAIEASPQYNVHLSTAFPDEATENISAFVDSLLWVCRPTTLTLGCRSYYIVKYMCENLATISRDNISDEQLSRPCWVRPC